VAEEYFEMLNKLDHDPKLETFLKLSKSAPVEAKELKPKHKKKIMTVWILTE